MGSVSHYSTADKTTWYSSFLGVRMQHNYGLYKAIDDVLNANPQIERFIEVGTGGGALSVILGLHAIQRNGHLLTYDTQTRGYKPKVDILFDKLDIEFVEENVFDNMKGVQKHMEGRPTFFFCDGGDKPKECKTFAPVLPAGSIIAVHDYGREISPEEASSSTSGYVPVFEERWLDKGLQLFTCFYKKL